MRLLEAVDNSHNNNIHSHTAHDQAQQQRPGPGQAQGHVPGPHLHDLASFIERIGRPWADLRYQHEL